ncbi:MAG TPA: Hpt domain-containing protein, partial [Ramlibacter sp.]|nr:Hpt domain-containing protein [Ramlibacter sp.]
LAQTLNTAIENVVRSNRAPSPELAMEVATAVLYLEAAFQDLDPNDAQLAERTQRLSERLKKVVQGGQPEPLEHWVEDLYRRVSDKQTMGSVVGELRGTMGELEKLLDQFFRNPADKGPLRDAPGFLAQMRGVLSVLGLDHASQAVMRMRETVEDIITTEIEEEKARAAGTFDKLGTNLGALGFLIDMLNYQPSLAKKLFVWDDAQGELRPLMGRADLPAQPAARTAVPEAPASVVPAPTTIAAAPAAAAASASELPPLDFAPVAKAPAPVAKAPAVAPVAPAPVAPAPAPAAAADEDDGDTELREIFLEEAREVVGNGLAALTALADDPKNLADMTTLRRAFHTLKGSSRMVGLNEFGEAAWSLEQVLNTWLADQKPAGDDLRALSTQAMQGFSRWIEDIADGTDSGWKAVAFRTAADTLRSESRLVAIELPGAAVPAVAAKPSVAVAEGAAPAELPATDNAILSTLMELDSTADVQVPATGAELPDLSFSIDLPAEPAAPFEASAATPSFDIEFDAAPATPSTEIAELSADELPPEFADFGAAAQPADELPELATTAILPRMDIEPPAPVQEPMEISGIDFSSLSAVAGPAEPAVAATPEPVAEPLVMGTDDFVFDTPAQPEPEPEVVIAMAMPEPTAAEAEAARDEQVKVIGNLRIGIPLYNVYLNEADEWSRRLATEISEWTLEMNQRVPDTTVGWAHSLAGSSATVGFQALSEIARALEGALQHTQSLACGTAEHARTFTEAAEEVRRLLHQFAAGFLKEPDPRLLQELHVLRDAEGETRAEPDRSHSGFGELDFSTTKPGKVTPLVQRGPIAQPLGLVTQPAARAPVVNVDTDEELDVVDAIDPDLFPIFEEEGAELMPQLGGALRQWAARPDQRDARDLVLRALHTLKGSARLAGALQLGELAHRLESEVEYLGSENINSADIEALLHRFDSMQSRFDTLRATGGFAPADAPATASAPLQEQPQVQVKAPEPKPEHIAPVFEMPVQPAPVQAAPAQPAAAPVRSTAIAM